MESFIADRAGRVLLLHLKKGDDLLAAVSKGIEDAGIISGVLVSGIGSLRKVHYHYISAISDQNSDVFETVEEPIELAALQGIVLEGKPHLHGSFSYEGGKCFAGHVELGCEVQYLAEIAILEIPDFKVGRRLDKGGVASHFEWL